MKKEKIMEQSSARTTARLSVLYFFIYCPLGALCPLISQYLTSIGFNGTQIGLITSFGTATAFFAGLFWGDVYANSRHKRWILAGMCSAAAVLALISRSTEVFVLYTLLYCCLYFFQSPIHGLCDSLVLSKGGNFPIARAFGAVGYAFCVFATGKIADAHGLGVIFYVYAAAFGVTILLLMRETEPPFEKVEKGEKIQLKSLVRNRDFVKLVICGFFVMGTSMANNTYFSFLFREGGGDVSGIGLAFLLMAGSEAPFMILLPGLTKRVPAEKLILFAMILSVGRFGFYASGPSSSLLLGTFFLQGMVNGVLLVEMVKYVDFLVGPKYSGAAIAVFYAVCSNLSVIFCNLFGGVILDYAGATGVYLFFTLYNAAAVVCYIAMGLYKDRNNYKKH